MKKKHTKRTKFFLLLIMCSLITSCVTRKQAQFFQDRKNIEGQIVRDENNIKIKPDDRLTIMVLSPNQEAARPFNPRLINAGGGGGGAGNQTVEYIVSNEGDIEFPVLGRIHVAGLTVIQLARYLEEQISPYLNDPLVNVNIANFYITFLGEVNQTINIPGDLSSAAFFIVASLINEKSQIEMKNINLNPTRSGFLTAIKKMGGKCGGSNVA